MNRNVVIYYNKKGSVSAYTDNNEINRIVKKDYKKKFHVVNIKMSDIAYSEFEKKYHKYELKKIKDVYKNKSYIITEGIYNKICEDIYDLYRLLMSISGDLFTKIDYIRVDKEDRETLKDGISYLHDIGKEFFSEEISVCEPETFIELEKMLERYKLL